MESLKTEVQSHKDNDKKIIDNLAQFIGRRYGVGIVGYPSEDNPREELIIFFSNNSQASSLFRDSTPLDEKDYQFLKDRYYKETAIDPNKKNKGIEDLIGYVDKAISVTRDKLIKQQRSVN